MNTHEVADRYRLGRRITIGGKEIRQLMMAIDGSINVILVGGEFKHYESGADVPVDRSLFTRLFG